MGYMKGIACVQRPKDKILRRLDHAWIYVHNVVTGAQSCEEHAHQLREIFELSVE